MKKTLALAIVLAAVITSAQTETTTTAPAATTTEAAPAAPVAKSKVKKAKKKKSNKAGAAIDSVSKPVAPVATKEAGLPATAASAANDAGKTVVASADVKTTEGAAAAGTSTVATADVAPTKKWGGFVNVYSTDDATDVQNIQTLTSIGGSYKIADKVTLKIGETFETLTVGEGASDTAEKREMVQKSNFRPSYLDINIGTKLPGMFGSNEQSASLTYRAMGNDSVYTTQTGYSGIVGMYEGNLTTVFAVTPKFEISVASQIRHVVPKGDQAAESNRVLAIPYFNYAINDMFTVYQAGGMIISLRDNMDIRRKFERVYLETGVSINATKNLNISLDVSQDKAVFSADDNVPVSNFDVYAPNQNAALGKSSAADRTLDAVAYEMYVSYSF